MIVLNNPEHGRRLAEATGGVFDPGGCTVISRTIDGELVGGCLFDRYTGRTVCMHYAGFTPNWISRELIAATMRYIFNQLGCESVFGQTPESNKKALRVAKHFGFRELVVIPEVFYDGGLVVTRMTREECRWLKATEKVVLEKDAA